MPDPETGDPRSAFWPQVGSSVFYYASPVSNPQPATTADNLGSGRYNLRVVDSAGNATAKANVAFYGPLDTLPSSGEYCCNTGALPPI